MPVVAGASMTMLRLAFLAALACVLAAPRPCAAQLTSPSGPAEPQALLNLAVAAERAGRHQSALFIYQRLVEEVAPRQAGSPAQQEELDGIVASAFLGVATAALELGDD